MPKIASSSACDISDDHSRMAFISESLYTYKYINTQFIYDQIINDDSFSAQTVDMTGDGEWMIVVEEEANSILIFHYN